MLDPTCGLSTLQKVVKVTALIDLGSSVACSIILSFGFVFFLYLKTESDWNSDSFTISSHFEETSIVVTNCDVVLIGISAVVSISGIFLAVLLCKAAKQRNATRCKIWMFLTLLIAVIYFSLILTVGFNNLQIMKECGLLDLVFVIYSLYQFCVVFAFIAEIGKEEPRGPSDFESIPFT